MWRKATGNPISHNGDSITLAFGRGMVRCATALVMLWLTDMLDLGTASV